MDDDCDGETDEGGLLFDDDGDGFVEASADGLADCNDADLWAWPGAEEDCDGRDNDCDGLIDEGAADEADGACAFVVQRAAVTAPSKGCSTASPVGWWSAIAGLLLLGRRRSRRECS